MECNQNYQEHQTQCRCSDNVVLEGKCNCASASADDPESSNGCFDCNICLDSSQDPVVTLCGHLYCWACIFEWLHVQTSSSELFHEQQTCPVCKASISQASLIPLYGRGSSLAEQEAKRSRLDLYIPPRPSAGGLQANYTTNQFDSEVSDLIPESSFSSNLGAPIVAYVNDPAQVMLGELFYMRLWSFMGFFTNPFPCSYYSLISSSRTPRMRRQEMQADKSLNRVSIFLLCCLILCLFSF